MDDLDILATTVFYTKPDIEPEVERLRFTKEGREIQRPLRSIMEDELLQKMPTAIKRQPGELGYEEKEDEVLLFAPIPNKLLGEYMAEEIKKEDIRMGKDLTHIQQEEVYELVMEYVSIFGKGGYLGHVKGYKATIKTEGDLPPP